jgi:hypothetical protein
MRRRRRKTISVWGIFCSTIEEEISAQPVFISHHKEEKPADA